MEMDLLQQLVDEGLSLSLISERTGKSIGTVRYCLNKYGLKTKYDPLVLDLEKVRQAAAQANSYASLERMLGMSVHSANYKKLRRFVRKHGIDVSHFGSAPNQNAKGVTNDELFTKSHKHSFSTVRSRVIRDNLIPRDRCAICGIAPIWNGKPLTFRLDHINGDHYDNRLTNLRFICANCDSQLDTYCHKNRKDTA